MLLERERPIITITDKPEFFLSQTEQLWVVMMCSTKPVPLNLSLLNAFQIALKTSSN